jgi:ketosteroid isomerase-like protein
MRLIAVVLVLLLPAAAAASPGVEQQIKSLEAAVNDAYQANDLPKYFSYYADDFRGLFPDGVSSKSDYVKSWTAFIKSGGRIEKFTYTDLVVQVSPSGDAAVASYHAVARTKNPGKPAEDDKYDETDVWFHRPGGWKLVEVHYSEAGKAS